VAPRLEARTVLIVDDDPSIRAMLTDALTVEGYTVLTASDGLQALHQLGLSIPDVVILDVMMPHADGMRVLESMRSEPRTRDVPVVMLTARTDEMTFWAGWQRGCDEMMRKPFELDDLFATLDNVLLGPKAKSKRFA